MPDSPAVIASLRKFDVYQKEIEQPKLTKFGKTSNGEKGLVYNQDRFQELMSIKPGWRDAFNNTMSSKPRDYTPITDVRDKSYTAVTHFNKNEVLNGISNDKRKLIPATAAPKEGVGSQENPIDFSSEEFKELGVKFDGFTKGYDFGSTMKNDGKIEPLKILKRGVPQNNGHPYVLALDPGLDLNEAKLQYVYYKDPSDIDPQTKKPKVKIGIQGEIPEKTIEEGKEVTKSNKFFLQAGIDLAVLDLRDSGYGTPSKEKITLIHKNSTAPVEKQKEE